ncbi:hypothetical protein M408DRAFT_109450 [Serendipita vermifera MAFF 305830]|uniref:Uncharacterized protein n=1 Tax=Serendipita vermifera MAFF 305830 TaxID=933852 RepID=A0A0C2W4B5_SERVB|nr:hypothetical protein M408DRAFT_109450 [Serendipita vermifera MAFF 305830]
MIKSISRCLYMDRVGGERKMNCPNRKTRDETRPQRERYEPDKHEEEGGSAKGEGKSTSGQEGTLGGFGQDHPGRTWMCKREGKKSVL